MNKRIAKKKYKQAIVDMMTARKNGVGVTIINEVFVDQNGKECDPEAPNAKRIRLRRPKIRKIKRKEAGYEADRMRRF